MVLNMVPSSAHAKDDGDEDDEGENSPTSGGPWTKAVGSLVLTQGWRLTKKVAIVGAAFTSAPLIIPPYCIFSTIGLALSVPFAAYLASVAAAEKVVRSLLPPPLSDTERAPLVEGLEAQEDGFEEPIDRSATSTGDVHEMDEEKKGKRKPTEESDESPTASSSSLADAAGSVALSSEYTSAVEDSTEAKVDGVLTTNMEMCQPPDETQLYFASAAGSPTAFPTLALLLPTTELPLHFHAPSAPFHRQEGLATSPARGRDREIGDESEAPEMAGFVGVLVSDPWLQNQFTQVELRSLKSQFLALRNHNGGGGSPLRLRDLSAAMSKLKISGDGLPVEEAASFLKDSFPDLDEQVDFELFLRVYLKMQGTGGSKSSSSAFLKAATTTLLHTISESEKASYVSHINSYLGEDSFLKKYLPIDPQTNDLFEISKDGVLLCKLINVAVPGTIDERAINTKRLLNPWEKNENHTLCLNSAKAIGCTLVNIGTQDLAEGRPHLVLGVISQIIKIQLLADVNLKKTPQLVELVDDSKDVEELMSLPPEKILLRWMNFQLKKGGFKRSITNFSSDVKDSEGYACLLNVLAPEHSRKPYASTVKDLLERAKLVLEHADRMGCKRYLTPKDIVEGSPNLNLAFVAHIFQKRNGLSSQMKQISFLDAITDDAQVSREERAFRLWLNSLGISTYINNVFEDLRNGWVLLEALDKISPGIVFWKFANKPPIKMPFRKVENCNQVVKIGKQLKFSLVNIAGNDIVQGNKKLILAFLWQLMRFNILQLLKNLRFHSHGKEITDADILYWANNKVKNSGRYSSMDSFKDKSLSSGIFFLDLLSAVEPRVVNWSLVTKGETDEEKKMNASYIISVARKLGCSVFLLPDDILEVNQKMMLTLTASIMYWRLKRPMSEDKSVSSDGENGSSSESISSSTLDDSASDSSTDDNASR